MTTTTDLDHVIADTADCLEEIADQLQEHVDSMRAEARSLRAILASDQEGQEAIQ